MTDSATSVTTSAARSRGSPADAVPFRSALLQRVRQIEPRGVDRRHQPEEQRRQRARARARTGGPSCPSALRRGGAGWRVTTPRVPARARTRARRRAARPAPRAHTFGQQLPHDTAPAGAERGAQRDLVRPARGAREQEVRDVGARDEQHDAARRPSAPTASPARLPVSRSCSGITVTVFRRFSGYCRARASPMVRIWACARARSTPRLELPDGLVVVQAAVRPAVGREPRHPEIGGAGIAKSRRRHADDLQRRSRTRVIIFPTAASALPKCATAQ